MRLFGQGFHYAAFVHYYGNTTSTGLAKSIPGDEFLVSLGSVLGPGGVPNGWADDQVGTFMHELGHNLGLGHGGSDNRDYKPNYLSVMNRMFQRIGTGHASKWANFLYSSAALPDLDENNLSAVAGIATDNIFAPDMTALVCYKSRPHDCNKEASAAPDFYERVDGLLRFPVNWACAENPSNQPIQLDVNGDGCIDKLTGFDDWKHIRFRGSAERPDGSSLFSAAGDVPPSRELDGQLPSPANWLSPPTQVSQKGPGTVEVTWSRIPLQVVIGYQLFRKNPSGTTDLIQNTSKASFVDHPPISGATYEYSVRPVLAGTQDQLRPLIDRFGLDGALVDSTVLANRALRIGITDSSVLVHGIVGAAATLVVK
jgi:hypothetical protein